MLKFSHMIAGDAWTGDWIRGTRTVMVYHRVCRTIIKPEYLGRRHRRRARMGTITLQGIKLTME